MSIFSGRYNITTLVNRFFGTYKKKQGRKSRIKNTYVPSRSFSSYLSSRETEDLSSFFNILPLFLLESLSLSRFPKKGMMESSEWLLTNCALLALIGWNLHTNFFHHRLTSSNPKNNSLSYTIFRLLSSCNWIQEDYRVRMRKSKKVEYTNY